MPHKTTQRQWSTDTVDEEAAEGEEAGKPVRNVETGAGRVASRHAREEGHPVATSFEPEEDWFWDYEEAAPARPVPLAPPRWRPADQPAPGPEGRVPENWKSLLHQD